MTSPDPPGRSGHEQCVTWRVLAGMRFDGSVDVVVHEWV